MCQVLRVQNSCGHRNDHVVVQCRYAKLAIQHAKEYQDVEIDSLIPFYLSIPIPHPDLDKWSIEIDYLPFGGFHASDRPSCVAANILCPDSPEGFTCMVHECQTPD